jgi:hypothetical protein
MSHTNSIPLWRNSSEPCLTAPRRPHLVDLSRGIAEIVYYMIKSSFTERSSTLYPTLADVDAKVDAGRERARRAEGGTKVCQRTDVRVVDGKHPLGRFRKLVKLLLF